MCFCVSYLLGTASSKKRCYVKAFRVYNNPTKFASLIDLFELGGVVQLRSRQAKLKRDISLIDDILREGKMSEAHLRMLVEKILVHEEDGRLDLEIRLKAPFRDHLDVFENGAQTDCFPTADFDYDRLGAAIYGDYYAG